MMARNALKNNHDDIVAMYDGTVASKYRIAGKYGCHIGTVNKYTANCNIRKPRKQRNWSDEEVELLRSYLGKYSIPWICKRMGRDKNSIHRLVTKRKICMRQERHDWYTAGDLVHLFGVSLDTIYRYIKDNKLKAERYSDVDARGVYYITHSNLVEFIRKYISLFMYKKVDIVGIVDILAGIDTSDRPA